MMTQKQQQIEQQEAHRGLLWPHEGIMGPLCPIWPQKATKAPMGPTKPQEASHAREGK